MLLYPDIVILQNRMYEIFNQMLRNGSFRFYQVFGSVFDEPLYNILIFDTMDRKKMSTLQYRKYRRVHTRLIMDIFLLENRLHNVQDLNFFRLSFTVRDSIFFVLVSPEERPKLRVQPWRSRFFFSHDT